MVKKMNVLFKLLGPIALVLIPIFLYNSNSNSQTQVQTPPAATLPTPAQSDASALLDYEKNTISIYKQNSDTVVSVVNMAQARRSLWDMETVEIPQGMGSGFVWNSEGYVITNFHVVQGGDSFLITFQNDKKQYQAKVVGVAPRKDIALLKLVEKPANLNPVEVGTSRDLQVGQKVMAIGNPFGFDHTMTVGIVSALDRKIDGVGGVKIQGMIQTDAAINQGNSGGPLLDSHGRLIGMNTAILSPSGASSGVGFAVPVDVIAGIVPQLMKHGKEIRPGLGIGILAPQIQQRFGIEKGIVVTYVEEKSAADKAGLKGMQQDQFGRYLLGDIIVSIDGTEVNSLEDINTVLEKYKVGDKVKLVLIRNEKTVTLDVTLMQL